MNAEMKHINRKVIWAQNEPEYGKWRVRLECGHEYLCDHTVQSPGMVMACPQCEALSDNDER